MSRSNRPIVIGALGLLLVSGCAAGNHRTARPADGPLAAAGDPTAASSLRKVTLRVKGMTWDGWGESVEAALVKVKGYKQMEADYPRQELTVSFDPKQTNARQLAEAINKHTKFRATPLGAP